MALGKKVRFEILKRDDFKCQYCGRTSKEVTLEVDHIIAKAQGGSDLPENLLTACFDCNRGKSKNALGATLMQKRDLKAEKKAAKQAKEFLKLEQEKLERLTAVEMQVRTAYKETVYPYVAENGIQSIRYFCRCLHLTELLSAVDRTASKKGQVGEARFDWENAFKYFCAICHNKISWNRENQRG